MNLTELGKSIRYCNAEKGFNPTENIHRHLLLVVSELVEAQEELRDGRNPNEIYYDTKYYIDEQHPSKPCGFPVEIADAIIRLLDIAAAYDINIEKVIHEKLEFNKSRPPKHGRQF